MSNSKTAIIIPIKNFDKSKSRLSPFLNLEQRKRLCLHLVSDLLDKISDLEGSETIIVTNESINLPEKMKKKTVIINECKNKGVNNAISLADSYIGKYNFAQSIVIPIDIPLLNLTELERIIDHSRKFKEGICIVPSYRFDGTNLLLRKPHSVIQTSYDDNSFFNHIKKALEKGIYIKIYNYGNFNSDVDNIEDIILVLRNYFFYSSMNRNSFCKHLECNVKLKNSNTINFLLDILRNYHQNC